VKQTDPLDESTFYPLIVPDPAVRAPQSLSAVAAESMWHVAVTEKKRGFDSLIFYPALIVIVLEVLGTS